MMPDAALRTPAPALPIVILLLVMATAIESAAQPARGNPASATNGMVVSAQVDASEAGVEVLRKGGNAIDAAVATGFALAVTYPAAGNLGGGGFMVIRFEDGRTTTFDFRETAPAMAHRDMYLDDEGRPVDELSRRGHLASGTPGSVAGLLQAHEQYGRLPLEAVINPAIRLASDGFILGERQAAQFNQYRRRFLEYDATARYFTKDDEGGMYAAGERFVQHDLPETLRRIRKDGRSGFYEGETAKLIVEEMQRGGGIISLDDLREYRAVERDALTFTYRDHRVISMAPPSSGGVALAQLLKSIEPIDARSLGYGSSRLVHMMAEAMRSTYADRAEWLGDPDFVEVPVDALIDEAYIRARMREVNPERARRSADVGHGVPLRAEPEETTHYSVVDRWGNAVSVTTTLNGSYGSYVAVDGAGFLLNNEMDDFSVKPGAPNMFGLIGNAANAIEPGKRMLSSMTPTIVDQPDGRLFMVLGTPGGSTIITTVFQVIMNVIDHGMDIQQAVAAPRFHHQWLPEELRYERFALHPDAVDRLRSMGWPLVERTGTWGRTDAILVEYDREAVEGEPSGLEQIRRRTTGRILYGGADPRGDDVAAGY